ncbi:hypothetical protein SDC9_141278 [bioreactor metagenome]|uniref:Uncharacterized protein n=1 Tax=bioreactor metagenome TaxID=1076179 RepID=A0A645DXU6_9ZZZZ
MAVVEQRCFFVDRGVTVKGCADDVHIVCGGISTLPRMRAIRKQIAQSLASAQKYRAVFKQQALVGRIQQALV